MYCKLRFISLGGGNGFITGSGSDEVCAVLVISSIMLVVQVGFHQWRGEFRPDGTVTLKRVHLPPSTLKVVPALEIRC